MSEKTEQPTPKKLRDARKKGQVASSKEVASAALILALFAFLWGMAGIYLADFKELILLPTNFVNAGISFEFGLQETLNGIITLMVRMLMPLVVTVILVAILSHFAQYGVLFALESLKPDIKKLNPMQGIKKIFSLKNLIEFLKSAFKIVFLSILMFLVIRNSLVDLLKIPYCGLECIPLILGKLLEQVILNAAFAFIVIAVADFAFQKFQFTKQLKMTKDEVKREYKEMEGDPLIKSKRKQFHHELMSQQMTNSVKKSTVVVTNPTHIAIALEYRDGETPLPIVRAKGENLWAQRIIEIAKEEGIPIMENVPLARSLHEQSSVDQYIPADMIEAVAEVLHWVANLEQQG
ncbi:MAG: type III secretion system export apparatus subunit SctU [Candidatus Competibacteraceae bacterium]|nr:type III secretion system export apparatus subunit SctU [Candidatus Competibacteraceae bacterium]